MFTIIHQAQKYKINGEFLNILKTNNLEKYIPTEEIVKGQIDKEIIQQRVSNYIRQHIKEFQDLNVNYYIHPTNKFYALYGSPDNWAKAGENEAKKSLSYIETTTEDKIHELMHECIYKPLNDVCSKNINELSKEINKLNDVRIFNKSNDEYTINQQSILLTNELKKLYKNVYFPKQVASMFNILTLDGLMTNTLYMERFPRIYIYYDITNNKIIDNKTFHQTIEKQTNQKTNIAEFTDTDKLIKISFDDNQIFNLKYPSYHRIFKGEQLPREFDYEFFVKERWNWQHEDKCYFEITNIINKFTKYTATPSQCLHDSKYILKENKKQFSLIKWMNNNKLIVALFASLVSFALWFIFSNNN